MAKKLMKGIFITLEGPEGCGKSTHSSRLAEELVSDGYKVLQTSEPGATALGKGVRELLLHKEDIRMEGEAELFLFEADRAQHVRETILPALAEKMIVICDRYNTATLAYQGYGLKMDMKDIEAVDRVATRGLKPDLTVLLDIDPETGLKRATAMRSADKMEKRGIDFHKKVRAGYLTLAKLSPGTIKVIDAASDVETVYRHVKETVYAFIKGHQRTE
jgi:dTMP kinase